jgi:hypothetical protein
MNGEQKQPEETPKEGDRPKEPEPARETPKEPSTPEPEPAGPAGGAEEPAVDAAEEPAADDVRDKLEDEIRKVTVDDVVLQCTVSILNLAARRIAKDDERDLEQGKLGIDASRALVEFLPEEPGKQVREALAELQLLYAKQAAEAGKPEDAGEEKPPA